MKCYKCWMLDVKDREIKQLKEQQEAILDMMQLAFCAVSLWAQATGLEKSDSRRKMSVKNLPIGRRRSELFLRTS